MITSRFMVVEASETTSGEGAAKRTFRNITLADPDGDGIFPVRLAEGKALPPALSLIDAKIRLSGFSAPAKSARTGNDYVKTTVSADLVDYTVVPLPKAA